MITDIIGKRYAEAVYEVAESHNKVLELYEDIQGVMEVYEEDEEFRKLFNHPKISLEGKKGLVAKIFSKSISEFSLSILDYIIERDRFIYLKSIVKEYLKIYYVKNNYIDVEATFAIEPTEEQKKNLIASVGKKTSKKVKLKIIVDNSIIAGGILKIGDQIIDGSLKRQFETLKVSL